MLPNFPTRVVVVWRRTGLRRGGWSRSSFRDDGSRENKVWDENNPEQYTTAAVQHIAEHVQHVKTQPIDILEFTQRRYFCTLRLGTTSSLSPAFYGFFCVGIQFIVWLLIFYKLLAQKTHVFGILRLRQIHFVSWLIVFLPETVLKRLEKKLLKPLERKITRRIPIPFGVSILNLI